jgi:catechol 2,3-dioxygenase-like lactoylglutathione lyase family enzyme
VSARRQPPAARLEPPASSRQPRAALALLLLALVALVPAGRIAASEGGHVSAVEAVSMTVSDLDRAVAFYTDVLTFTKVSEREVWGDGFERLQGVFGSRARVARLKLGDEQIELVEYLAPRGRPIPVDSRSNDRWFQHVAIIVSDMDRAYARLREHKVEHASPGPQTLPEWNPNAGGIKAFYFKDPDGHPLEILWFPPDKGAPKWHRPGDRLFLGIDHTAIAVSDTDRSLEFYRDTLGLTVAGESDNHGIEQERLNNVFGAHLRITGLRAAAGFGIEFLEYLTPRDGRPRPRDWKANDLVHRQTLLSVDRSASLARRLQQGRVLFVSPAPVTLRELALEQSFVVRDPDGHALQFVERMQ